MLAAVASPKQVKKLGRFCPLPKTSIRPRIRKESRAARKERIAREGPRKSGRPPGQGSVSGVRLISRVRIKELDNARETPLDVMLNNMLFWHHHVEELTIKIREMVVNLDSEEARSEAWALMRELIQSRDNSQKCAVDAAPYCHAKFASVEFTPADPTKGNTELPTDPVAASIEYQRLIAGK